METLSLFDKNEPELYHPAGNKGFFSILTRSRKSGEEQLSLLGGVPAKPKQQPVRQSSYLIEQLPYVLDKLNPDIDTWISQAEFFRPNRRVVNLARLSLLFVDLDTYNIDNLVGKKIDDQARFLRLICDDRALPQPSVILFSGRGLQAKWLLSYPIPRAAVVRWNRVQSELVEALSDLGADRFAKDASRVLRVEQTVNSKSGEFVRVVDVLEVGGLPIRYDFEDLAQILLPVSRDVVKHNRLHAEEEQRKRQLQLIEGGKRNAGRKGFNVREWAWVTLEDLRQLAGLRGWTARGVPKGFRSLYVHWSMNFLLLSGATHSHAMFHEAQALVREVAPTLNKDMRSILSTLYRKAKAYEAGEKIEYHGRKYTPLYTPSGDTLAELFALTEDEQWQMRSMRTKDIRRAKKAVEKKARRHKIGETKHDQESHLAKRKEEAGRRREKALSYWQEGKNKSEIARLMDVDRRTVIRWLKGVT